MMTPGPGGILRSLRGRAPALPAARARFRGADRERRPPIEPPDTAMAELREALGRLRPADVQRLADAIRRSADQLPALDAPRLAEAVRRSAEHVPERLARIEPIRIPADTPVPETIVTALPFVQRRRPRPPWRPIVLGLLAVAGGILVLGLLRRAALRRRATRVEVIRSGGWPEPLEPPEPPGPIDAPAGLPSETEVATPAESEGGSDGRSPGEGDEPEPEDRPAGEDAAGAGEPDAAREGGAGSEDPARTAPGD